MMLDISAHRIVDEHHVGPSKVINAKAQKLQVSYTIESVNHEEEGCGIDDVCDMVVEEMSAEKNKELMKHSLSGLDDLL